MIIDSKQYNGICSCGKKHLLSTQFCVIESGCLRKIDDYLHQFSFSKKGVAIYDENTYQAVADRRPSVWKEIILPPRKLHADNHGVALAMNQIPEDAEYLIAIGSGTIHDITRYCAYQQKLPFVSCPTAASVDGFCSSVAAMTWDGFKKSFTAASPSLVIADLDIISEAPIHLAKSGFGDMIGKYIALAEWKLGNLLTKEYFCSSIYQMTMDATDKVLQSGSGILTGNKEAYGHLMYGLLLSGLAMQLLGNSRCASGAEHHISHLIEMEPAALQVHSDALHGEKVGVATLLVAKEYHRIKDSFPELLQDYTETDKSEITAFFGDTLAPSIIKENLEDSAKGITGKLLKKNQNEITAIINEIPSYDTLFSQYQALNIKCSLNEIGVPEEKLDAILDYSPLVRNRLTLMRLRRGTKQN